MNLTRRNQTRSFRPAAFAGLVRSFLCEKGRGVPEEAGELTQQGERS